MKSLFIENIKSLFLAVMAAISIGSLLPTCAQAQAEPQNKGEATTAQGLYDKPARMRDLSDLLLVDGTDLSPAQKTEVLLSWLAAERHTPSATTQGLGGGPIGTSYLQAQMVIAMETQSDPTAVAWVASSPLLKDEGVRDGMKLVLGFMGDQTQVPALEKILRNNPNPDLRALAAGDLGLLGSVSSIPVLEAALKDNYSLTFIGERDEGKMTTRYPVRRVVEETLSADFKTSAKCENRSAHSPNSAMPDASQPCAHNVSSDAESR